MLLTPRDNKPATKTKIIVATEANARLILTQTLFEDFIYVIKY